MRANILKAFLGILTSVCVASGVVSAHKSTSNQYPALLQISGVEESQNGYVVKMRNSNGFTYRIKSDCGDYEAGEFYSCIMDDSGTANISDDTIVKMHYVRVDQF